MKRTDKLKPLIKCFLIFLTGIAMGVAWTSYHYIPIIKDQEKRIDALNKGYVKQFSKHFIAPYEVQE